MPAPLKDYQMYNISPGGSIREVCHEHHKRAQCDLCQLKFTKTDLGRAELLAHRGHRDCRQRRAEKEKKVPALPASDTTTAEVPLPSISVTSYSSTAPPVRHEYPAVFSRGSWSKKCDLCEGTVNLGGTTKGNCFESHRNSKVCQKARTALGSWTRKKPQAVDEQPEKPKGLMKFFQATSSQATLDGAEASSSWSTNNKVEVASLSVPAVRVVKKKKSVVKSKSATGNDDLTPANADLRTLARDVRRALAELPVGTNKRKNAEGGGNATKKPKVSGVEEHTW